MNSFIFVLTWEYRNRSQLSLDLPYSHSRQAYLVNDEMAQYPNNPKCSSKTSAYNRTNPPLAVVPKPEPLRTSYLRSSTYNHPFSDINHSSTPDPTEKLGNVRKPNSGLGRRLSDDLTSTIDSIRQVIGSVRQRLATTGSVDSWTNIPFLVEQDESQAQPQPKSNRNLKSSLWRKLSDRVLVSSNSTSTESEPSSIASDPKTNRNVGPKTRTTSVKPQLGVEQKDCKNSGTSCSSSSRVSKHKSKPIPTPSPPNTATNTGKGKVKSKSNVKKLSTNSKLQQKHRLGTSLSLSSTSDVDDKLWSSSLHPSCSEYTLRHPKRALGTRSLSSETAPEEKAGKLLYFPILKRI